jgi:hypothetical protein
MRDAYLEVPEGSLEAAGTVMLDWNISARIANIHRRQERFEPLNLGAVEVLRLRNLVKRIPEGAEILSAFGAAEPETRRLPSVTDVERYNTRTDVTATYLSAQPDYLLHLLGGGQSGGLVIESQPDEAPYEADPFRAWFMVSYAALLSAAVIDRKTGLSRAERADEFRFWLEHELRVSASREAWVGFLLLAGTGDQPGKARRLLKLDGRTDIRDAIWGAAWDLMYTRIPGIMAQPKFRRLWKLPIVFVTDDSALPEALAGMSTEFLVENAHGVHFAGDRFNVDLLHPDARPLVQSYVRRESKRVFTQSRGMRGPVIKRAAYLARVLEGRLGQ